MGVNHIAIAVKDIEATHRFYTEAMGFALVKVEIVPKGESFTRHVFYSTGSARDQMIAFWDLSKVSDPATLKTDICRDLGLAPLTNHLAFSASDVADLMRRKERWLASGHDVLEIDHGWIHSIYTEDPDGIAVEFAVVTKAFTERDATEALELLRAERPAPSAPPVKIEVHKSSARAGAARAGTVVNE
jgi:catechol 2,3-dioxygenase-like lactoylglutathione lyase family enzyme